MVQAKGKEIEKIIESKVIGLFWGWGTVLSDRRSQCLQLGSSPIRPSLWDETPEYFITVCSVVTGREVCFPV